MDNAVVYFHINKQTHKVFYVGIGVGFRPFRTSGRSVLWNRVVVKHGFYVKIIHQNLSWQEAKEKEVFYINHFGRIDNRTGILVNHTDGGDGTLGCVNNVGSKRTEESRQKISRALKGRKINPVAVKNSVDAKRIKREERKRLGIVKPKRIMSESELARIRTMNIGKRHTEEFKKIKSEQMKGRVFSEETKRKISEAKKGCVVPEERRKRISETLKARNAA